MMGRTALCALTVALLVEPIVGAPALGEDATIVVASDGTGDQESIADAIGQASDGDTIVVLPGRYGGALTIDRDVTLRGEGPAEAVILALDGGQTLRIASSNAIVSGLTLTGATSNGVEISGGAPTLSELVFHDVADPDSCGSAGEDGCHALTIADGSRASVEFSRFTGGGSLRAETGASPRIEANAFAGGSYVSLFDVGDRTIVRGNRIEGSRESAIGVYRPTVATIEENHITGFEGVGIEVWLLPGTDPLIRGNTIERGDTGIHVLNDARPAIIDNDLATNGIAIGLTRSSPSIEANRIHANDRGISMGQGSPTLRDNVITDNEIGLDLARGAAPTLAGNTFCGNGFDINLRNGAEPPATEGNYSCPAPPQDER
jgi:parallel beta-helix repeat protein